MYSQGKNPNVFHNNNLWGKKAVNEAAILKTIPRTNTELAIRFVAENTVEKAQ